MDCVTSTITRPPHWSSANHRPSKQQGMSGTKGLPSSRRWNWQLINRLSATLAASVATGISQRIVSSPFMPPVRIKRYSLRFQSTRFSIQAREGVFGVPLEIGRRRICWTYHGRVGWIRRYGVHRLRRWTGAIRDRIRIRIAWKGWGRRICWGRMIFRFVLSRTDHQTFRLTVTITSVLRFIPHHGLPLLL